MLQIPKIGRLLAKLLDGFSTDDSPVSPVGAAAENLVEISPLDALSAMSADSGLRSQERDRMLDAMSRSLCRRRNRHLLVTGQRGVGKTALAIVRDAARWLKGEFSVTIEDQAIEKAVTLSSKFIWNQCQPAKAIRILERVCEDVEYGTER